MSADPLVELTGQPYAYAADDPVNETDPLGLWGWNPISDISQAAHDTVSGLDAARHVTASAGDWVNANKGAIGLVLLGTAVVVGGILLTGGLLDVAVAAGESAALAASTDAAAGSAVGALELADLGVHLPFVFAPGGGLIGIGLFFTGWGAVSFHGSSEVCPQ